VREPRRTQRAGLPGTALSDAAIKSKHVMSSTFAKLRDGIKEGFNRLTGGSQDASHLALVSKCEDCVAEGLCATNWPQINELCSMVRSGDVGCASPQLI
jgi:hypothetical protein